MVTLEEVKGYLRLDTEEDDARVEDSLKKAYQLCLSISRLDEASFEAASGSTREAVLYTTAYLYTHREEADYRELTVNLRHMLMDIRKEAF